MKEFPSGKQDFKCFTGCKNQTLMHIRPLCIFFPEMSIFQRNSDKSKRMYFMIKYEKFFNKYMTVWEKSQQYDNKKFNSELIYNRS